MPGEPRASSLNTLLDPFPIASERDFLVLYPARADALELRWRLATLNKQEAEAAFGLQASRISPGVVLRQFGGQDSGDSEHGNLLPVASLQAGRMGLVGLQPDAWYQAELGLGTQDGGWLMLARSNRLALPPPAPAILPPPTAKATSPDADLVASPFNPPVSPPRLARCKPTPNAHCDDTPHDEAADNGSDAGGKAMYGEDTRPVSGSGPLRSVRDQSRQMLWAKLRIGGQAAPGSLLELGGHPYRVGSGGGFAFDFEIRDPEVMHALLRLLPTLPVVPRDQSTQG